MKEEDRLYILEKIDEIVKKQELLDKINSQIKELEMDEKVKKYIDLTNEAEGLNNELQVYDGSKEKVIETKFDYGCCRGNEWNISPCEHEIYFYRGSFYFSHDKDGKIIACPCNKYNERSLHFDYNSYQCLECNDIKNVDKDHWKLFEQEHTVLKMREDVSYKIEYFHLLMNYPVDETQKILVNKYGVKK